jgi:hypothetical protein
MVLVDGEHCHWLVGVAVGRNLLRPVRRSFQMTYAMCGALCWSVASWLEGRRISDLSSWTASWQTSLFTFAVEFVGEII